MGEDNINNGCDQFTRPEEILELQKYLRAIKEDLAERTNLGTDVVQMDPSYRAGNISLDHNLSSTGRVATNMNPESERIDFSNAILGVPIEGFPGEIGLGEDLEKVNQEDHKSINKLPDTKDTINVERIERLEKVREKLLGADTNSPRKLETYVEKLDVAPEKINLGNELIKVTGESKEVNLSQERVDLVEPKFIDSLGTEKEKMSGEIPELTLGEGSERIPFLETKVDQLPNHKESVGADQGSNQEKIELGRDYLSIPKDHGMMFDSSREELPDAVLGIPGEVEEVSLGNTRINLPEENGAVDLTLPDFLDKIEGEKREPTELSRKISSDGNVPQGQKDIDELGKDIPKEGKLSGEDNLPDSLEGFLTEQGIIPGTVENIGKLTRELPDDGYIEGEWKNPNLHTELPDDGYVEGELKNPDLHTKLPGDGYVEGEQKYPDLHTKLPKDGYIEGEQKNPDLHTNLPEDGYIEGELKNTNLHTKLPEDSYIKGEQRDLSLQTELPDGGYVEGELKNPNLYTKLPEDGYTEGDQKNPNPLKELPSEGYTKGELKNPNLSTNLPEDGYIEGEQKSPNLHTKLPENGYIEGEQKNPNLHTELPKDSYVTGEFEDIDELRTELPKDGHTKGEFEEIDKLRTKLPKDGHTKGEFENIGKLPNKLSKKDGKVRGEFEDIDELARRLPKKDGYVRGDFKKIKNLANELPEPDGYPSGSFKEVEKLTKKLPEDGFIDGDFVDLGDELTEELPVDGYIEGDFKEIKELTEELPVDGLIEGDVEEIKRLPNELPKDGQLDEEDLVEITKLSKNLTEDGKITEGKFHYIEGLDEKISSDGKVDGDFRRIDELTKILPEGGLVDGDFHNITDLPDELPRDGYTAGGEGKEIKTLTKDLPTNSYIEGDFKDPKPNDRLPKDGHIGEDGIVEIGKLTKDLPNDGHTEGDFIEIEKLTKVLPDDGHIGEDGIVEIGKLTKKLPDDGHIGEDGIIDIQQLTKELPEDGHIEEDGIVEIEELPRDFSVDGKIPGEIEEIYGLDSSLSMDGRISGDFKEIEKLTKELPNPDGYTQGDLVEITELDKALSTDGLIHGDSEAPFSEEVETENLFYEYSSNQEMFSVIDGTVPRSSLPLNDDWEHTTPEDKFNQYTGGTGGIYVDPVTREVKYDGNFQIPDGIIAPDTFPVGDPEGGEGLRRRRPLNLDNKEFDEIDGLVPDSTIPSGDDWEHRKADELDNKEFDEIGGLVPNSTIPIGDDWKHSTPEERIDFYSKSVVREKSVNPETKEREYKGEFNIEEGIVPDSEIPRGDIWEHEDFEKQFKLYENSAVRIESVDAEGNIKYKGEFKFDEGIIPENSRPKDEPDPRLYEWLRSLEKIDSGAGDLYHALLERAGHNLEGYYTYLMHYAENKDLSSGWGQKIATFLSEMGGDSSVNLENYKNFDYKLSSYVMKYYEKEGRTKLEQSHLPRGLDAYMSTSGYLRYMADLVRSGYNGLEKEGSFWGAMQGALGLKEIMLDKLLMQLVDLRDKSERQAKANRDRLPGGTGIVQEMIMDMDVWKSAVNLGRTFLEKVRTNKKGILHGDTTDPINRPVPDEISYDPEFDQKYTYDNFGNNTRTEGWYDPHAKGTGKEALSGWDLIKSSIKDTFAKSSGQEINYRFDDNYLQGAGIKLTLYDLAERDIESSSIDTVEEMMDVIRQSPLITSPTKFLTTNVGTDRVTTTLDTNNYWEVVIEPYIGKDNGFCSYLPSIEEINILNFRNFGVKTLYSRWLPIVSFDLSRSRAITKSIGLFGGEFTIPGGVEYSNELRITIVDDIYKSWRRYFEKCADVGVYNSRIHKAEFYGYEFDSLIETPNVKSSDQWRSYTISEKDAEKITVVDKSSFVLAPYKNVTFRIRIYIMTPQYSTINKYDLLATLKEVSIERVGEIDPGSQDLELSFSIVGETDTDNLIYPAFPKYVDKTNRDLYNEDLEKQKVEYEEKKKKAEEEAAKKKAEAAKKNKVQSKVTKSKGKNRQVKPKKKR